MTTFQFSSHQVDLEFPGGLKYTLPLTDELQQKVRDSAQKLLEASQALKGAQGTAEDMEELCDITMDAIDDILGEGRADEILGMKENYSFLDCADVFKFITDEITGAIQKTAASYNPKPQGKQPVVLAPQNRAQRRHHRRSK